MQPLKQQPDPRDDALDIVEDQPEPGRRPERDRWKILVVDDDYEVHAATKFVLGRMELLGRPLELIEANNNQEAQDALLRHPDVAVILLDVVMEEYDSGLKFARWVREAGQHNVRIILRTGQPGYAPEVDVIRDYDINDYRAKSELTQTRLITSMTAAIRSFEQIETIERSRRGLEMIVASCSQLFKKRELASFSQGVLMQIASLCGVRGDGLICASLSDPAKSDQMIVSALGELAPFIGRSLADLPDDHALKAPTELASRRPWCSTEGPIVLSVDGVPGRRYVASLDHGEPLDRVDSTLLGAFSANIAVGFENVGLMERLDRLAFWDEATLLPNRNRLVKDLAEQKPTGDLALVRILSYVETLTAFGQEMATGLMTAIAARLSHNGEPVYRFSEDVLALVAPPRSHQVGILRRLAGERFPVGGQRIAARLAVGCAELAPSSPAAEICERAYAAVSHAAIEHREEPAAFDASMIEGARDRIELMAGLRDALDAGALDMAFQPIVDLTTGGCVGFEALARWDREGQPISPRQFIPLAEQAGLTLGIFALAVRRAAELLASFEEPQSFYVSINLSACDLCRGDLVPQIVNLLARTVVPPGRLQIEITEQSLIDDLEVCERNLASLGRLGCRIAIDDFGAGYSSLSYIGRLPVHALKLDQQFVAGLAEGAPSEAIVGLTRDLASRLGLEVVAKGVETAEQQAALERIGCRYAQGYRFGRPMPLEAVNNWLVRRWN